MPRQVRIQFPGAVYHVMARGDRREAIFHDDEDRRMFLAVLLDAEDVPCPMSMSARCSSLWR